MATSGAAENENKLLEITVTANDTKVNKAPWDGIEGVGGGHGGVFFGAPTSGPPDLAVCVVWPSGQETSCIFRKEASRVFSLCQNSFDCDFHNVPVPNGIFGLVIIDIDVKSNDLVDFLILSTDGDAAADALTQFEGKVRAEANRIAPPFSSGEKQRREREALKFSVSDCKGTPCTLRQSKLLLNWTQK